MDFGGWAEEGDEASLMPRFGGGRSQSSPPVSQPLHSPARRAVAALSRASDSQANLGGGGGGVEMATLLDARLGGTSSTAREQELPITLLTAQTLTAADWLALTQDGIGRLSPACAPPRGAPHQQQHRERERRQRKWCLTSRAIAHHSPGRHGEAPAQQVDHRPRQGRPLAPAGDPAALAVGETVILLTPPFHPY